MRVISTSFRIPKIFRQTSNLKILNFKPYLSFKVHALIQKQNKNKAKKKIHKQTNKNKKQKTKTYTNTKTKTKTNKQTNKTKQKKPRLLFKELLARGFNFHLDLSNHLEV